ncbi:hypothetical protein DSL72_007723 [Monilinia vaccinii-corymbosi]|uniref:Uncharacterized protein n=1 Tax=Monilinia vaccinii-corymbosi TaxID=61207 RepID=A0A8A3PIN0_9HELO|nr:hypothetical protein DSL72_007723 [Monilinia vaccinii-corymbosi]
MASNKQNASPNSSSAAVVTPRFSDHSAMAARAKLPSVAIVDLYMSQKWHSVPKITDGDIPDTFNVSSTTNQERPLAENNTRMLAKRPEVWPNTFVIPSNPSQRIGFEAIHPRTPFLPPIWRQEQEYDAKDASYKVPTQFIIPFDASLPSDGDMRAMLPVFIRLDSIGWVPGLYSLHRPILVFWGTRNRGDFVDGTKWRYFMGGDQSAICYRDHQWQMGGLFAPED